MSLHWTLTQYAEPEGMFGTLVVPSLGQFVTAAPRWIPSKLPGFAGEPGKSCLPDGIYQLVKADSPKYGKNKIHLVALGVVSLDASPDAPRSDCMFHALNQPHESEGCIGAGMYFDPGFVFRGPAVVNSGEATKKLESFYDANDRDHYLRIQTAHGMSFVR